MEQKAVSFENIKSDLDFPGGAGVKNPPVNAGDTGSIPGPGRSHMPAADQLSLCATTTEPACCNY